MPVGHKQTVTTITGSRAHTKPTARYMIRKARHGALLGLPLFSARIESTTKKREKEKKKDRRKPERGNGSARTNIEQKPKKKRTRKHQTTNL